MKAQELFPTTSLIVALVPATGLGTKITLENTGPNFSVGWTVRPTDNIAVYRRYASVCAIRMGVQTQARPPWPSVPKISLTGTSSAARPGLPSHGHRSVPSVSRTQVCTFRLSDTGLYHPSHGHRSVPSVSRTQVCTIRLTDTGLYLPSLGDRSVPSVSRTQVCTIRLTDTGLYHPSQEHRSVPSVSRT